METIDYLVGREKRLARWDSKVGYRSLTLKIARAVVFSGLSVIFLTLIATVFINQATAVQEYKNAHSFIPVHLNK